MASHDETERTFEVPRRWAAPLLVGIGSVASVEGPRRFTQTATYLDTPTLALLRAKHTLRRRVGGTDAGWHLKQPAVGDTRRETQEPLGTSAARVPASLRALVADVIGTSAVVPVAVLRNRRTQRRLLDAEGALVAELVDDSVEATVLVDGERIVRWREVELELGPAGTVEDLDYLTEALERSRLLRSASPSKLGRALAEPLARITSAAAGTAGGRPGRRKSGKGPVAAGAGEVPAVRPDATAGEAVIAYLSEQLGVLQALEQEVRDDAPDAVHRARVATRRARSALRTYRDLFDREVADELRAELSWLADLLGGPRDAEVLKARLASVLDTLEPELLVGPVRDRILGMLDGEHDAARAKLVAGLDGRRYERLLTDLTDWVLQPPYLGVLAGQPASEVVPPLAAKAADAVVKAARRSQDAPEAERDILIHDIRKRAKAARYAAEAAAPIVGKKAAGAPGWTALQEALGDHQDGVVATEAILRALAQARAVGEDAFSYGVLVEREAAAGRAIRASYGELLKAALANSKGVRAR